MRHISALSPRRLPVRMMRVYPPSRVATFTPISRNNSVTAYLLPSAENASRRLCVVSSFDRVTMGSTNLRSSFAFATVVTMRLCSINEHARFESSALRCPVFRPKWLNFLLCRMALLLVQFVLAHIHTESEVLVLHEVLKLRK